MTERYLGIDGGVIPVEDDASDEEIAGAVMRLLVAGEPWVQLWHENRPDLVTRWTVLSRNELGVPMQIGSQEFDGTMEVLNNDPQYEA